MISVIVPIYNSEPFLTRCIESILNQTFPHFELLLINDGSTDNSGKICDEYAEKDNRIRVFHGKNQGVSNARNTGIKNAIAPYITFIDSDDYIPNNYLEVLYQGKDNDITFVGLKQLTNNKITKTYPVNDSNGIVCYDYLCDLRLMNNGSYCKLLKSDIIRKNDLLFRNNISYLEDVLFSCLYLSHCKTFQSYNSSWYNYCNVNTNSLMKQFNKYKYNHYLTIAKKITYCIINHNNENLLISLYYPTIIHSLNLTIESCYKHNEPKDKRKEIINKELYQFKDIINKYENRFGVKLFWKFVLSSCPWIIKDSLCIIYFKLHKR